MNNWSESVVNRSMRIVPSLRRGDFPISRRQGPKYWRASFTTSRIIHERSASPNDADAISGAKGMFGRSYERDLSGCVDWSSVWILLGKPDKSFCHRARETLGELRRHIVQGGDAATFIESSSSQESLMRGIGFALRKAERALAASGFDTL